jgi:hypothetical protein
VHPKSRAATAIMKGDRRPWVRTKSTQVMCRVVLRLELCQHTSLVQRNSRTCTSPLGAAHAIEEGTVEPVCGSRATVSAFYDRFWDETDSASCRRCAAEVTRRRG